MHLFLFLHMENENMKYLVILYLSVFVLLFGSCHKDDDFINEKVSRTVLVYIAADNTLRNFSAADVEEMIEGMSEVDSRYYNLIYYIDNGISPKLVKLETDEKKQVTQKVLMTYTQRNSVGINEMKEICSYVFSRFPADSYGMVFWSHGEGWIPSLNPATRWVGQDISNGTKELNIMDFHRVLQESVPHLDFLLFDACFMQSVEVAYELRDCADYFIGSPTEIPGVGAPYQKIVPAMFEIQNPEQKIAKAYYEYYADPSLYTGTLSRWWKATDPWTAGVSISVIKSETLGELANVTNQILPQYIQNKSVIPISKIMCYDKRSTAYYYDFDNLMKSLPLIESEYDYWKKAFDAVVVYWKTTDKNYSNDRGSFSMVGSSGLSSYIPTLFNTSLNDSFHSMQWYSVAGWSKTGW